MRRVAQGARACAALFAVAAVLAHGGSAAAQHATVLTTADRTEVGVGETFSLRISVEAEGGTLGEIELPNLDAFEIIGQRSSRPMQFSFSFGGRMQSVRSSHTYDFTLLARTEGTFKLGPAKAKVGGRTFSGNGIEIRVGPGAGGGPLGGAPDPRAGSGDTVSDPAAGDNDAPQDRTAFVRITATPSAAFVGEQVTVQAFLYTRSRLSSQPTIELEPSMKGFWVQSLLGPNDEPLVERRVVGGITYFAYEMKRVAAFPLTAGEHTIGPMRVSLSVGGGGFFGFDARRVVRESEPVSVHAEALPAGAGKSGAIASVGRYSLEASLDRSTLRVGDAATVTLTLTGTGNLRDLPFTLPEQPGLRVFAPEVRDALTVSEGRLGGTRTVRWLVSPDAPGEYTLAPFVLDAVDPDTGAITPLRTAPLRLTAAGGTATAPAGGVTATTGTPARPAPPADDAPAPYERAPLTRRTAPLSDEAWYRWALVTPAALWLGLVVARRLGRRRTRDKGVRRPTRVSRELERMASGEDAAPFYRQATRELRDALDAALGERSAGITLGALRGELISRGMPHDFAERLTAELEGFEYAQFSAAGSTREEREKCLGRVQALLERLARVTLTTPAPGGERP